MIKILIADDEQLERELLRDLLTRNFDRQAEVRLAANGREAADTGSLWRADLVLMDIDMPGMSGIDAARQILQQNSQCRIIFVTAYSLFRYAQEAVRLGARDYILKPVDEATVVQAVQRAIGQIESQQDLTELARERFPVRKTDRLMQQVAQYLHRNYMYDVSLEGISDLLSFSPPYFSRLFKQHFGITFIDYLTDLRIRAAQQLLLDPMKSTAEVAGMVGYEDASYFARAFKKKTGMTPTQYRSKSKQ